MEFTPDRHVVFSFHPAVTSSNSPAIHYFTSPMLPGPCAVGFALWMPEGYVAKVVFPGHLGPHVAPASDRIHYVDGDAPGRGDGSNWENAYLHLQDAIAAAAVSGGEIRVAQGVYHPDRDRDHPEGSSDRDATFLLLSNLTIKGGYAGWSERLPDARDIELYETVLSGDLLGDDSTATLLQANVYEARRADNSRRVITAHAVEGTAVLDGLTVAHGSSDDFGLPGGAVYATGSPTILNCRFVRNVAGYDAAAYTPKPGKPAPVSRGGAVYVGALTPESESAPYFANCIFQNNCAQEGSALYAADGSPQLVNCTFVDNVTDAAGTVHCVRCSPTLTNCILWGNQARGGITEKGQIRFLDSTGPGLVNFCCIQELTASLGGFGDITEDPLFVDRRGGDYHLQSQAGRWDPAAATWVRDAMTSPCIDAGARSDPVGREPFPNGGIVNLGAYGGTAQASKSYFGEPVCETIIPGDINGDCRVDWADLCLMAVHWCGGPADIPLPASTPTPPPPPAPPSPPPPPRPHRVP